MSAECHVRLQSSSILESWLGLAAVPVQGRLESVPQGDTLPLFITGQGSVSPPVATGAAPSAGTPLSQLPAPTLPVKVTIGAMPAPLTFVGIPPGLVGVTQINFQIPPDAPLGPHAVVVSIGDVPSASV